MKDIYKKRQKEIGEYAKHYVRAGANIIGGCCGTLPEHIKRMWNWSSDF